jgi:hypothetical protein
VPSGVPAVGLVIAMLVVLRFPPACLQFGASSRRVAERFDPMSRSLNPFRRGRRSFMTMTAPVSAGAAGKVRCGNFRYRALAA